METNDIIGVIAGVAIPIIGLIIVWRKKPRIKPFDQQELITIAEFINETDAYLWKSRLESQGIECTVIGTAFKSTYSPISEPAFTLRLRAGYAERARKFYKMVSYKSFQV